MKKNLFFLICILFCACNEPKIVKTGLWQLSNITLPPTEYGDGTKIEDPYKDYVKLIYSPTYSKHGLLELSTDKKFTLEILDDFFYGEWNFNENKNLLVLKGANIHSKEFELAFRTKFNAKEQKMVLNIEPRLCKYNIAPLITIRSELGNHFDVFLSHGNIEYTFLKDSASHIPSKLCLHSKENNQWRVKPLQIESNDDVKKRLRENLYFIQLVLQNALTHPHDEIDYQALPKPITIATHGIGLLKKHDLPRNWINLFFNEEQAELAYDILYMAFQNGIKINHKKTWLELDIDILEQIMQKL